VNARLSPLVVKRLIALQFKAVGLPYRGPQDLRGDWYHRRTWTAAQKEAFRKVFLKVIGKYNKQHRLHDDLWLWWDMAYGWKDADE